MNFSKRLLFSIVILLIGTMSAHAWLRRPYEDATVVERSGLIVVGHLEAESIKFVAHEMNSDRGKSWEHHATLVITDVLKGITYSKRIPIVLHYGLSPLIGGLSPKQHGFSSTHTPQISENKSNNRIYILDRGSSAKSFAPLVSDAGKNNLWFLRKDCGAYGEKPGTKTYGICDPEDLQPLAMKEYYLAYLSDNPVVTLNRYAKKNPEVTDRVEQYVDHVEVQKLLKIKDPRERFDKLLPYYLKASTWNMKSEARNGIISCGNVAGEKFLLLFNDPEYERQRKSIIQIWSRINYEEATPVAVAYLVDILKREDKFWAMQDLEKGWWNKDEDSERRSRRRASYREVYYAVCSLKAFQDPRSKDALELTRKRWKSINFENPQILEACEEALKAISQEQGMDDQQKHQQD